MRFLKIGAVFLMCFISFVQVYAEGKWTRITEVNGYPLGILRFLALGPDDTIWFGGNGGLFHYDNDRLEQLLTGYVSGVVVDSSGTVWVARENNFLKYDGETFHTLTPDVGPGPSTLYYLVTTPDGSVWGTCGRGGIY